MPVNLNHIYRKPESTDNKSIKEVDEAKTSQDKLEKPSKPKTKIRQLRKNSRKSDQYLLNKINIALSESNNSQNIKCHIETGSMQELTISSRTPKDVSFILI